MSTNNDSTLTNNAATTTAKTPYYHSDFERVLFDLIQEEPFLSTISIAITKRQDEKMPTAYVSIDSRTLEFVLGYNPEFFSTMTRKEQLGVVKHELYHLLFKHLTDRMPQDKKMASAWNISCDLSINSIIGEENLPKLALIPGKELPQRKDMSNLDKAVSDFIKNAPKLQASEWYYGKIKQLIHEDEKNGGNGKFVVVDTLDDHGSWENIPEEVRELIKEKLHGIVEKAVKNAEQTNRWGSVPLETQERIKRMVSREVDWRTVLKNFLGRCRNPERNSTIKKINKKFPYIHPGVRRKHIANFACFIDQSGSVSNQDLEMFFGELESLSKETKIETYHFDTEIDESSHTVWTKGKKITPSRTRNGGTDFACVSRFVNKKENRGKWSGIILLTDGYADKMPQVVGCKVLWVITPNGTLEATNKGDLVVKMHKTKTFEKV